jgi:hypothetical protein
MQSSEGLDEFGFVEAAPVLPSEVKIETAGEIVSSVFETQVTQDAGDKRAIETIQYGDLQKWQRGSRPFAEIIWTTQKGALDRVTIAPFASFQKEGKDFIVCGTNGTFCFALECAASVAQAYLTAIQTLEQHSFEQELDHRLLHLETQGDAEEFLNLLQVLLKREHTFEKLMKSYLQKVEEKMPSLPAGKETYTKKVHPVERVFPVITTLEHKLLEKNKERLADQPREEYTLYYCNTSKLGKSAGWVKAKMQTISATPETVPCLASNETHLAVLFQAYDEPDPSVVTIQLYRLNEHPAQKPCQQYLFQFPKEHFTEQGLLNMTMNNEGVITVAFANGVVAINTNSDSVRIFLAGNHIVMSSSAYKNETVLLGTNMGECIGVDWKTGDVVFTEITPVVEPIYSVRYSNKRVFMHTACAISGRMTPYQTDGMTHLPSGRLTGMDVCGTLVFALEKYGNIQVFSSSVRGVVFPFKPPKEPFETPLCLPHYASIKATTDRVVALYQNGLIVIYYISNEGHRWIETHLNQKKKEKKKTKQKK